MNAQAEGAARPWWFCDRKGRRVAPPAFGADCPVVDAHTHLASLDDPVRAVAQAAAVGMTLLVDVVDPTDEGARTYSPVEGWFAQAAALLAEWGLDAPLPRYRLVAGIHPHNARLATAGVQRALIEMLADPRTCAIGEIGLDYHYDFSPRDVQREVFARQLALAGELGFPVELHLREAQEDAVAILREVGVPSAGCDIHCFTAGPAEVEEFLGLGCHIGIGGAVTFPAADQLREAVALVPVERLLTETDAPYMTPVPLRGTDCQPAMTAFTLRRLIEERGLTSQQEPAFCQQIERTARGLLDREPTAWQRDPEAVQRTLEASVGWVADEDSARMEAQYQADKRAYEERQAQEAAERARLKEARRMKQQADQARKEAARQAKRAAGDARNAERMHAAARAQEAEREARGRVGENAPLALILIGSPRRGITVQVADRVRAGLEEAGVAGVIFSLAQHRIKPCIECDLCLRTGKDCFQTGSDGDDMDELDRLLDDADLLVLATPLFFAGPPSQLKAAFDRFQPRWSRRYLHGEPPRAKRPAHLLLTGTGDDPYGQEAAITIARSGLAVAGFRIPQAIIYLMPGSEATAGAVPPLGADIAQAARALGRQIAPLAFASREGSWSMGMVSPEVALTSWDHR